MFALCYYCCSTVWRAEFWCSITIPKKETTHCIQPPDFIQFNHLNQLSVHTLLDGIYIKTLAGWPFFPVHSPHTIYTSVLSLSRGSIKSRAFFFFFDLHFRFLLYLSWDHILSTSTTKYLPPTNFISLFSLFLFQKKKNISQACKCRVYVYPVCFHWKQHIYLHTHRNSKLTAASSQ